MMIIDPNLLQTAVDFRKSNKNSEFFELTVLIAAT